MCITDKKCTGIVITVTCLDVKFMALSLVTDWIVLALCYMIIIIIIMMKVSNTYKELNYMLDLLLMMLPPFMFLFVIGITI